MERYTVFNENGTGIGTQYGLKQFVVDECKIGVVIDKLGAFEDLELTPDQIKEMEKTIDRLANIADHADNDRRQALGEMEKWKAKYEVTRSVIAKLRDWLKIEGIETERYLDYLVNADSPTPTYVP